MFCLCYFLYIYFISFSFIIHIHTVHPSISIRPGPLSPFYVAFRSEGKTSLGCRAEIRIRACHTAELRCAPTEPHCNPPVLICNFYPTNSSYLLCLSVSNLPLSLNSTVRLRSILFLSQISLTLSCHPVN